MAARIFLALVALVGVMWYLSWYSKADSNDRNRSLVSILLWGMAAILVLLVVTGRIPWLFALIGAAVPWINRALMVRHMWRRVNQATGTNTRTPPPDSSSGSMNREEALKILGLEDDATEDEVIVAHRKLIQKLHPDRGGSGYLASWINEARDTLMNDPGHRDA